MQDSELQQSVPAKHVRPGEQSAVTSWCFVIAAFLFGALAFVLVTVQSSPASFTIFEDVSEDFRHGLPFTYMTRDSVIPNNGMTPGYHLPWPFFGLPPLRQIHGSWLVFDSLLSLAVVAIAAAPLGQWVSRRSHALKLFIIGLSVACALGWIVIASCSYVTYGPSTPLFSSQLVALIAFLWIAVIPAVVVLIFVLVAIVQLMHWALTRRVALVRGTSLVLFDGVLLALFACYVANDAFYFAESTPLLSLCATSAILILATIGVARRIGAWLSNERHLNRLEVGDQEKRDEPRSTEALRLFRSIWIATFVVGWTTVYFAFFDMVTYVDVGNGRTAGWIMLDGYGWPWVYKAEYDSTAEIRASAGAEGYPIDIFRLGPLTADAMFVLFAVIGTLLTLEYAARRGTLYLRFSLRTFLLLFIAVPVALHLPHAGDYHILWPNWFARLVLYFATACASFGTLLAIDRGINRYLKR